MVINLSENNSVISQYLAEIRDINVQQDRLRFRSNIKRIGTILGYEISKKLAWRTKNISTPLAATSVSVLQEQPVIAVILRAGMAMHEGMQEIFDGADTAFISAYRRHDENGTFDIHLQYAATPAIEGKALIICDPMLASGASMVLTLQALIQTGKPSHIHIATVIATHQGITQVEKNIKNCTIWTAAIDKELNEHAYIIPGLGDAGDLAYGEKVQR